ncbi:hypothetical protein L6164_002745 [Bauhinia variegata]|uniref:Uncharacterized protein n=1 Tax=Bauhinia variegata TaxID=167791 RepID=A0ACB9PZR1_BAUVA|nr:hypothetical protein L6164_002745 [Bauhinia variegata]
MAIQVTVFPNTGFCIGVIFHYAVVDGRAFHHSMKSWASICRTGGFLEEPKPLHSRVEIEDTYGLEKNFLEWWNWELKEGIGRNPNHQSLNDNVRATVTLSQTQIQCLKNWVSHQYKIELAAMHTSTFVRRELVGEFGLVQAIKAIGTKIKELEGGAFKGAEEWMLISKQIRELGHQVMIVCACRKFVVYKTDFGWGKLKKTEVGVEIPGNISLVEGKDEEGGIEIVLTLPKVMP